jgi:hypothetical protein
MRRLFTSFAVVVAVALSGCGGKFQLPTEHPSAREIPSDGSYTMEATWTGMDSVQDVMMTSGNDGSKVFVLFNRAATTGPGVPRGSIRVFKNAIRPYELSGTAQFANPLHLFNPIAMSAAQNRLYVLDAGDSCMAKYDEVRAACDADPTPVTVTTRPRPNIVRDYSAIWRVRIYPLEGGDTTATMTSITDTTMVRPYGIAVDDEGAVYVAGLVARVDTNAVNTLQRERQFDSRVFRYLPGPRYNGVVPADINMPGCNWHRDTTWVVYSGSGSASVADPRGLSFSRFGVPSLFIADRGNNQAKTVSVNQVGVGFARFDGRETGSTFNSPEAAAADRSGFLYVVDRGNRRVLRYDQGGNYIQIVNTGPNSFGQELADPVAIGVNDTLAFVGDRGNSQIIRYKRRP